VSATVDESSLERIIDTVMLVVFWIAFSTLAIGLMLWLVAPSTDPGTVWLDAGVVGLLLNPALRLARTLSTAIRRRDWLLLLATLAVIAILAALTLPHATS
jgi:hypothetical protein